MTESRKPGSIRREHVLVDLSHPITSGMTTYPGLPGPVVGTHLSREASRAGYSGGAEFFIGTIEMVANTGTYLDAPFHRYPDGVDVAHLPLDRLAGLPGVLVEAPERVIGPEVFTGVAVSQCAVLIRTGWDTHFGETGYVGDHPHLTEAAARHLIEAGAGLVGIDSSNIDDTSAGLRPVHTLLLGAGIPIVEHLTNLEEITDPDFEFFALPAPVVGMGSFPVRAVARLGSPARRSEG